MEISVVVPYYESRPEKRAMLKKCIDSLKNEYDELFIINDIESRGMTRAVVQGHAIAHGDFIIVVSDDAELSKGTLHQLLNKDAVTSPLINGKSQYYWGPVFCTPRWVYEKAGTWDIRFDEGFGYDDTEYVDRLNFMKIPMLAVPEVDFYHPWGGTTIKDTGHENVGMKTERNKRVFEQILEERYKDGGTPNYV